MTANRLRRTVSAVLVLAVTTSISVSSVVAANGNSVAKQNTTKQTTQTTTKKTAVQSKTSTATQKVIINPVKLTAKSYITLKQIDILPEDQSKTVVFTINVYNGDLNDLQFIDYWLKLTSKSGTSYSIKQLAEDKDKNRIPSQTSQEYTFYASVNKNTNLQDLLINIIKWDFSQANFEKKLGQIGIPANYSTVVPANSKKTISITGTAVKANIASASSVSTEKYNFVKVQFNMDNLGYKDADLSKYSYFLRTADGLMYPLNYDKTDTNNTLIQSQDTLELELSNYISKSIKLNNLQLVLIRKEDNVSVRIPAGVYALPSITIQNDSLPVNGVKVIKESDIPLNVSIRKVSIDKNKNNLLFNVTLNVQNAGTKEITLPQYDYSIRTTDGLNYPLTLSTAQSTDKDTTTANTIKISPKANKDILVTATMPYSVNTDGMILFINKYLDKNNVNKYTVASFYVSKPVENVIPVGNTTQVTTSLGNSYDLKLTALQRIPWPTNDQDLLNAELTITNTSKDTLPIPDLEAKFLLDGVAITTAAKKTQNIKPDEIVNIPAGSSYRIIFSTTIPYTNNYTNLDLKLNEKDSTDTLVDFKGDNQLAALPSVTLDDSLKISVVGKDAQYKVRNVQTYSGESKDLLYVELEGKNTGARIAELPKLTGYFKNKDGSMFEGTVKNASKKIGPNGKALISIQAEVPKGTGYSDLELVMAQSLKDDANADSIVNAVVMQLPKEVADVKNALSDIKLYPYTLSLSNIKTTNIRSNEVTLGFDYSLTKNADEEALLDSHKLLVEFVSDTDNKSSKEFVLESGATENGIVLPLGEGKNSISFGLKTLTNFESYTIRVYDQIDNGYKKLIAEQKGNKFTF